MTTIVFNPAAFRANPLFSPFSSAVVYTDPLLDAWFGIAREYISDENGGYNSLALSLPRQTLMLDLMVAHLLALGVQIGNVPSKPKTPGLKQSATIDKISISLTPPPAKNQWQWWLSLTPYGQQLFALQQIATTGGAYYGGFSTRDSFRR